MNLKWCLLFRVVAGSAATLASDLCHEDQALKGGRADGSVLLQSTKLLKAEALSVQDDAGSGKYAALESQVGHVEEQGVAVVIPGLGTEARATQVAKNIQWLKTQGVPFECWIFIYILNASAGFPANPSRFEPCHLVRHQGFWMGHVLAMPLNMTKKPWVIHWLDSVDVHPDLDLPQMLKIMRANKLGHAAPTFSKLLPHAAVYEMMVSNPNFTIGRVVDFIELHFDVFTRGYFACLQDNIDMDNTLGWGVDRLLPALCGGARSGSAARQGAIGLMDNMTMSKSATWTAGASYDRAAALKGMNIYYGRHPNVSQPTFATLGELLPAAVEDATQEVEQMLAQVELLHDPMAAALAGVSPSLYSPNIMISFTDFLQSNLHSQIVLGTRMIVVSLLLLCFVIVKLFWTSSTVERIVCLGIVYNLNSASMIETNKWLMHPDHFPYPIALTAGHMLASVLFANCLRLCCPSAFPALGQIQMSWQFCLKFLPIGAMFAVSIVCANSAYQYLSVSFLQIMKQCNVAIIYALSVICGLEAVRRCSITLLTLTVCGALLAVKGELHFQLIGFLFQIASSSAEAGKIVAQGVLMTGSLKLDPLTLVLFMAPACLLAVIPLFCFMEVQKAAEMQNQFALHYPVIFANAALAFSLNVVVANCIKMMAPVGYAMMGTLKDVFIVTVSTLIFGETLTAQQIIGFILAVSGVFAYSLYKQNIDCFQKDELITGAVLVFQRFRGTEQKEIEEAPESASAR